MLKKGLLTGLLGGVLWLVVMAGFDLYAHRPFSHTPKIMATLILGTAHVNSLPIGLPYLLGAAESLMVFVLLGIVFVFLSTLLPIEVSVVLGFIFGGATAYFLFFVLFCALPKAGITELDRIGLVVGNLAVGVAFGLRMHK